MISESNKAALDNPDKVERIVFCSGKIYYELAKERKASNLEDKVVIARIEQVKNLLNSS